MHCRGCSEFSPRICETRNQTLEPQGSNRHITMLAGIAGGGELRGGDGSLFQMLSSPRKSRYKKRAIPQWVRRELALRYGCQPGERAIAKCEKCENRGSISWARLQSGRPSYWVHFSGLELDHINPEVIGGKATPQNMQLLCRRCNRSKGHRT